jgi:hypothetical protein
VVEERMATRDLEEQALGHAIARMVPPHLAEVRAVREPLLDKTEAAVKERLTKEIIYWDHRAAQLREDELRGKANARLNSAKAIQRRDELPARLRKRLDELEQERQIAALPPVVIGGALVVPGGMLAHLQGQEAAAATFARDTVRVERMAMAAVLAAKEALGHIPRDVSQENLGYDIESHLPASPIQNPKSEIQNPLRFTGVKGRIRGAPTVTVTRNEILTAFNKPQDWILALVEVPPGEELPGDWSVPAAVQACRVRYLHRPFQQEPDFAATSVNYHWGKLWKQGEAPS